MSEDRTPVTILTVADSRFFLGTVGMVNSLRLTGTDDPIIVVDVGLTDEQRSLLATTCELRRMPDRERVLPAFLKPAASLTPVTGILVMLDGDIIVTGSLRRAIDAAADGRIAMFPDGPPQNHGRRFDSWSASLGLRAPLRDGTYVNSGFLAVRWDRWNAVLERWRDLSSRVSEERSNLPHAIAEELAVQHPFAYLDQDVLNAILLSEVPAELVDALDWRLMGTPEPGDGTRIVDRRRFRCVNHGVDTMLVHFLKHPKPWYPHAARHGHLASYSWLLARALSAPDAPIRVPAASIPPWLRDDLRGRALRAGMPRDPLDRGLGPRLLGPLWRLSGVARSS